MSGQDMRKLMEAMAQTSMDSNPVVLPTREEYQHYVQNFKAGNFNIDYAFRNVFVLDEEQIRIIEDYELAEKDGDLNEWVQQWKPQLTDQQISVLQRSVANRVATGVEEWTTVWLDTLEPYISNKELFEYNDPIWEMILLFEPESYEDFVNEAKDALQLT